MTNFILGLIIGIIVGVIVALIIANNKKTKETPPDDSDKSKSINPAVKVKQERLEKLSDFISKKSADDKITNNEVEKLLNISDATAERYLQELESKGVIRQIGESGKHIYYQKTVNS